MDNRKHYREFVASEESFTNVNNDSDDWCLYIRQLWSELRDVKERLESEIFKRDAKLAKYEQRLQVLEEELKIKKNKQKPSEKPTQLIYSIKALEQPPEICPAADDWTDILENIFPSRPQNQKKLVLFGGAGRDGKVKPTVEEFDGGSGLWTEVTSIPEDCDSICMHATALPLEDQAAVLFSSFSTTKHPLNVFKYDNRDRSWIELKSPDKHRLLPGYGKVGDKFISAGGYRSRTPVLSTRSTFPFPLCLTRMNVSQVVEMFDPGREEWIWLPSLRIPRVKGVIIPVSENVVYCLGGLIRNEGSLFPNRNVERLDLRTSCWVSMKSMMYPRAFFDAVNLPDGRMVALGGLNRPITDAADRESGVPTKGVETYDIRQDVWTALPSMPTERCMFTADILEVKGRSYLYAIGGTGLIGRRVSSEAVGMDVYDVDSEEWITAQRPMLAGFTGYRQSHASCVL